MSPALQIELFGAFAVRVGGAVVPEGAWRLRKAKTLVKLLALAPDRRVHRERATELLWPDRGRDAAANNFHQALYVARRALEAAGAEGPAVLALRDDMLVLCPGGQVEVDVDAFDAAVARARETGTVADLRAALALHGGELLPEDRYEPWASGRREALGEAHLGLLLDLAGRLDEGGEAEAAIEALEQAVVLDPLHEGAHRALMRLFAAAGRRQQALLQFQRLRETLRHELAAEPDPQTAALYRALLRGEGDGAAPAGEDRRGRRPARGAPRRPRRPAQPPDRAHELRRARAASCARSAALLGRHRLLTLTGAGRRGQDPPRPRGRLGRGVGAQPDGVWLVELAGLGDAGLVPAATAARARARRSRPSARPSTASAPSSPAGAALLVLDNCEHLVAACARPGRAPARPACPGLRILATSREPLRVAGRGDLARAVAGPAGRRPAVTPAELESLRVGAPVLRAGGRRRARLRAGRRQRRGGRRDLRARSTGCRSPSSSPRRAWGRSRPRRSPSRLGDASPC